MWVNLRGGPRREEVTSHFFLAVPSISQALCFYADEFYVPIFIFFPQTYSIVLSVPVIPRAPSLKLSASLFLIPHIHSPAKSCQFYLNGLSSLLLT